MPKKPSVVIPARDRLSPPPAMEAGEDLPTAQDVFLNVVKTSQLADDIKVFLTEWILVSDSKWEDPRVVREALLKANVPQAKADQLAKKFESTMELIQRRDDRNRGMASLVAGDLGGSMRFRSPEYLSSSSRAGSPSRSGDDDLETATINALLERNGHRVTVDVLRQIDELRAMFAMRRGEAAPVVPGSSPVFSAVSSMSPQSIQQMIQQSNQQTLDAVKQMLESRNQKEKDEAREIERKAADDKRYQDMMNLMTMAIASKNSVPIQPVESPEKMMLGQVMDILKEKMTAPPPPPPKDLTEHPLFVKLFDKITNDKPSEAMQGVYQQLDSLKDQIGHIGGGPAGLPSNPEQLHAYVDYMKTMHDIDKTKREFEDKAETRKVIATVATSALQSIGEAIAATYTQNPGTPQAREVTVEERRVDDGSVIQFACPSCKAVISAPATARAVKCPSCGSILDRAGQTMSEEQLAELQRQVLAEQAAAEEGEMPAAPEEPKVETPPLTVAKPSDPHELGPVSRQMHVAAPSPPPPAPAPVEESPVLAAVNETDLSQSEQPPAQETG